MNIDYLYENRKIANICFLGSHHWKVFGLDKINPDSGDMFTDKRRKELEELLNILESYKPTKVMIEWPAQIQEKLDIRFSKFLKGKLNINSEDYVWEGYQIGFNLAKRLGHDRIYGVDNRRGKEDDLPFDQVMGMLQDEKFSVYAQIIQQYMKNAEEYMNEVVNKPLIENYKIQNSKRGLWLNQLLYLVISEINTEESKLGLELATQWYNRNLGIFTNISNNLEFDKDERILVIFGQGHVPYLIDSVNQSPYYELTEFSDLTD